MNVFGFEREPSRAVDPRREHYGEFYGLRLPHQRDDLPTVAVVGNCQAESLRILLDSTGMVNSFRIPPIHEWTDEDVCLMHLVLNTVDILVMQPVRDDYRGLACGTAQLTAFLPPAAQVVTFPVLRFDGLMPYHAIIRAPLNPSLNPPLIPYHDLRILAAASGHPEAMTVQPPEAALRACAAMSISELRGRETNHHTVMISDFVETSPVWHTINHPDNSTLMVLARRVLDAMGISGKVQDPGRELLGGLQAPVDPHAARALGVEVTGRETWSAASMEEIDQAHLEFYREHPSVVAAGLKRHAQRLRVLRLTPP